MKGSNSMKEDKNYRTIHYDRIGNILLKSGLDLTGVPEYVKASATDIHISVGQSVMIYCLGGNRYTVSSVLSRSKMDELFFKLCDFSVYKHTEEMKNGFISIGEGYRCGICGTCVSQGDDIVSVRNITSLNIRVPHEISGIADPILQRVGSLTDGLLLIGEPSSGKTTILKDIISHISAQRTTVIDERYELGSRCQADVMLGYNKAEGICQAIRAMSPQYLVCDELDYNDIDAVNLAVSTGVSMIASVHGRPVAGRPLRPVVRQLLDTGAFNTVVVLKGRANPGSIEKICEIGEFYESYGRCSFGGQRDCLRVN